MHGVMLKVVSLCLLTSVLVGCNSIQVVDNMYGPVGGQHLQVSSDFEYLGNPNVYDPGVCQSDCPTISQNVVKIRSDLFATKADGKISEICVVERRMLIGSYFWNPIYGKKVFFGEKEYTENYWAVSELKEGYIKAYMNFLENAGYSIDVPDVVGRVLMRNLSSTVNVYLFYGCDKNFIPEDIRGDYSKETEFIKKRFEERFVVIDS